MRFSTHRKERITMTQNNLDKILENHKKWLNGEDGGSKANLWGTDLRGADLQRADLQHADLQEADLPGADLRGTNLFCADLQGADLWGTDLRGANLFCADLQHADIGDADLRDANLRGANLRGADFRDANLQAANLRGANLRSADFRGANIDYSCWPLWCGSWDVKIDRRIFCQLAYHLCRVIVDDNDCKEAQLMLGRLANEFHWVNECGRVPETPKEDNH